MTCGIYKIENLINHKIYIGQSKTIGRASAFQAESCEFESRLSLHELKKFLHRVVRLTHTNNSGVVSSSHGVVFQPDKFGAIVYVWLEPRTFNPKNPVQLWVASPKEKLKK